MNHPTILNMGASTEKIELNTIDQVARLIQKTVDLINLTPEQFKAVTHEAMLHRLAKELNMKADRAGVEWEKEKTVFLENTGNGNSHHTRVTYAIGLKKFDAWTCREKINPLELTHAQADDFIYALRSTGAASATIRKTVAAASSFYEFLSRRHKAISNPFRNTKARPKLKRVRPLEIPTANEVERMLRNLPPILAAAVAVMSSLGLRAGALPKLSIKGERYFSLSKGKEISGDISMDIVRYISRAGLPLRSPFADRTANRIECAIRYHFQKWYRLGKLNARYSCHDLRHFAAIYEYNRDKDIRRVRDFLKHSSIATTETYLRGLGETNL